jgi:HEAT repeat protein
VRRGRASVVAGCADLLLGGDVDADLLRALAGPAARPFLSSEPRADEYWLRVWGARGLLWAWDDSATQALRVALGDEAWRVREMALKVVARHRVDEVLDDVVPLQEDPVPRVRAAAARAMVRLTVATARPGSDSSAPPN